MVEHFYVKLEVFEIVRMKSLDRHPLTQTNAGEIPIGLGLPHDCRRHVSL